MRGIIVFASTFVAVCFLNVGSVAGGEQNLSIDDLERYAVQLIDSSRAKEPGVGRVEQDSSLMRLARKYAEYMRDHRQQYVAPTHSPHMDLEGHNPRDRAREAGIYTEVHENLGMESRGFQMTDQQLVAKQHQQMMSEPAVGHTHRAIIMDPAAVRIGVGIAHDANHLFLCEEFSH
jgi:uncharacterized protein YkwD